MKLISMNQKRPSSLILKKRTLKSRPTKRGRQITLCSSVRQPVTVETDRKLKLRPYNPFRMKESPIQPNNHHARAPHTNTRWQSRLESPLFDTCLAVHPQSRLHHSKVRFFMVHPLHVPKDNSLQCTNAASETSVFLTGASDSPASSSVSSLPKSGFICGRSTFRRVGSCSSVALYEPKSPVPSASSSSSSFSSGLLDGSSFSMSSCVSAIMVKLSRILALGQL